MNQCKIIIWGDSNVLKDYFYPQPELWKHFGKKKHQAANSLLQRQVIHWVFLVSCDFLGDIQEVRQVQITWLCCVCLKNKEVLTPAKEQENLNAKKCDLFPCLHLSSLRTTAVVPAIEEMHTPYTSGREICTWKIQKCVPTIRNRAFQKHLYHHWTKHWNVVRKRCTLSFHNTRVPSVIVYLV